MTTHPEKIARTLDRLASFRVNVHDIDEGYARGKVPDNKLVMTSMGDARKAFITPTYPALCFEPKLLNRLDWAAVFERPFIEASLRVKAGRAVGSLSIANVTLRLCREPRVNQPNMVLETAAQFLLDEREKYGTTESVVQAVVDDRSTGITLPHRTGVVYVPVQSGRSKDGKWSLAHPDIDPDEVAQTIHNATYELPFAYDLD